MYKNILHATDLCENHFNYCEKAASIAKFINASLFIMHVIEPPNSLQLAQGLGFAEIYNPTASLANAKEILTMIGESLDIPSTNLFVEIGSIKELILTKAYELDCNLIIIGRHKAKKLPEFLQSSAHNIETYAKCDVLSIY